MLLRLRLPPQAAGAAEPDRTDEIVAYVARAGSSVAARLSTPLLILDAALIVLTC
jgi:hypothetical protein